MDREQSVQHFLDLIKKSHRGKFKVYINPCVEDAFLVFGVTLRP